jgi:hypothetical protein
MTIRELRREHPGLFYQQEWYLAEDFMDELLPECAPLSMPKGVMFEGAPPELIPFDFEPVFPAVVLVNLYCLHPYHPIWRQRYLWTASKDHMGQRVYVGDNGHGIEIHRHLHINERWGLPVW